LELSVEKNKLLLNKTEEQKKKNLNPKKRTAEQKNKKLFFKSQINMISIQLVAPNQ
jgi:hypothetical protein